jgi:hypothetical protein
MNRTAQILMGIVLWGVFVIFASYMYALDAMVATGSDRKDNIFMDRQFAANAFVAKTQPWRDVVRLLSLADIELLKDSGFNIRGLMCKHGEFTQACVKEYLCAFKHLSRTHEPEKQRN